MFAVQTRLKKKKKKQKSVKIASSVRLYLHLPPPFYISPALKRKFKKKMQYGGRHHSFLYNDEQFTAGFSKMNMHERRALNLHFINKRKKLHPLKKYETYKFFFFFFVI